MAYQYVAAIPMTFSDLHSHSHIAVDKISTDITRRAVPLR